MAAKRRICVVGAGRWGRNHIRTLSELGALAGVVEPNEETVQQLAADYPTLTLYTSVDDALAEPFDGFVVATPAYTHFEIAMQIVEAGRHVFVEKPITLVADDARKLVRLARDNDVNLMVGHLLLFHPAVRKMRELVRTGKLGKLQYLYSNRLNLGTVRTEENILWSFAPHDISIFQHLIGSRPLEVESRGGVFLQPGIHDTTMTLLRYPENIVGHIFLSWLHPYKEHRLVVVGSKGMFSFEDSSQDKQLLFYEKGIDWVRGEPIARDGPTEVIPYEDKKPLTEALMYFIDHLDGSPLEIADGMAGVEVLEILERATLTLLSKRPETTSVLKAADCFVHPSSYVDEGAVVGEATKIWHFSHVQKNARIGRDCVLGQNVNIGPSVVIGNSVKIQNNVSVYEGVELEDYVFCGPSMVFTNVLDPRAKYPKDQTDGYRRTLVKHGASIGANATILCGTTVGRHAFIAAGAVVSKDVPDYALMMGVPATRVAWMCECGARLPEPEATASCLRCGRQYELKEGRLVALRDGSVAAAANNS